MKTTLLVFSLIASFFSLSVWGYPLEKTFEFNFLKNEPFHVSFADYPSGQEGNYELWFKNEATLPPEIQNQQHGLMISGNNHSDDLFMYAYKKISGLKPNSLYKVQFSLQFASNAPVDSMGVGGAPGDSVYVKIGAVTEKPTRFVNSANLYQIRLDKGNQRQDGNDMILIGTIGVETNGLYRLKSLPDIQDENIKAKLNNYRLKTNSRGEAWLIFGTDSGFESTTTIFYTHLWVRLLED